MIYLLFLLAAIASVSNAQVVNLGQCPSVSIINNLDNKQFSGKWYVSERYVNFLNPGKCVVHNFMDAGAFQILTTMTTSVSTNVESTYVGFSATLGANLGQTLSSFLGSAAPGQSVFDALSSFMGTSSPGQSIAVYPSTKIPIILPYGILNTDYTSYAVAYTCIDLRYLHMKFLWILTRDKNATIAASNAAYGAMDWAKLNRADLKKVDHSTCSVNH